MEICPWSSGFSIEKSSSKGPPFVCYLIFFLAPFNILSFFCTVSVLAIMCHEEFPFCPYLFCVLYASYILIGTFFRSGKFSSMIFVKIFFSVPLPWISSLSSFCRFGVFIMSQTSWIFSAWI